MGEMICLRGLLSKMGSGDTLRPLMKCDIIISSLLLFNYPIFSIWLILSMKVHLIATTHKTIKSINPHDAKMEMLMEENNRLRKQLEVLLKEKNDDIENVFRNKLEQVRSSSKSISKRNSKANLSPKPAQPLRDTKN